MPRAIESDDAPKRTPRRRASSSRASVDGVPRKRAPRKRVATPATSESTIRQTEPVVEREVERKAPTPLASSRSRSRAKQLQIMVSTVIVLIGVGTSAAVGMTDKGQIDVNQTIEERNERIRTGQVSAEENTIIVPVQNTNVRQADGGMTGRGVGAAPPPPPVDTMASSTDDMASSTEAMASSTDETIENGDAESSTETADSESTEENTEPTEQ